MSAARAIPVAANSSRASAYVSLTKPDVSFLVVMTTLAGFGSDVTPAGSGSSVTLELLI